MSDAAGSSITDLLINQPVLVWSLAGGLAILVLAGLLSVFLALRSRFSKARTAKEALREQRKNETAVKTAVTATKPTNEPASAKSAKQKRPEPPPAPAEPAPVNEAIADDQKGFLLIGEETGSLEIDEATLEELAEAEEPAAEPAPPQEANGLAALFSADAIVDPYVKALRDHLQVITTDELLTNIRSISQELREQISATHAAKN